MTLEAQESIVYRYISDKGESHLELYPPTYRSDLRGYYHPYESWRCICRHVQDAERKISGNNDDMVTDKFINKNQFSSPIVVRFLGKYSVSTATMSSFMYSKHINFFYKSERESKGNYRFYYREFGYNIKQNTPRVGTGTGVINPPDSWVDGYTYIVKDSGARHHGRIELRIGRFNNEDYLLITIGEFLGSGVSDYNVRDNAFAVNLTFSRKVDLNTDQKKLDESLKG